jgi:hypothetical protein
MIPKIFFPTQEARYRSRVSFYYISMRRCPDHIANSTEPALLYGWFILVLCTAAILVDIKYGGRVMNTLDN